MRISKEVLRIDPVAALRQIEAVLPKQVFRQLKRRGVVVGLSGGIDSSVTTAICAKILGCERVVAMLMPEKESEDESTMLGQMLADKLQVRSIVQDIGPLLEATGCYRHRDDAIRTLVPDYGPGSGNYDPLARQIAARSEESHDRSLLPRFFLSQSTHAYLSYAYRS